MPKRLYTFIILHGRLILTLIVISIIVTAANRAYFLFFLSGSHWMSLNNLAIGIDIDRTLGTLPAYPNATLTSTNIKMLRFNSVYEGEWQTKDDIASVASWYLSSLSERGWKINIPSADIQNQKVQLWVFEKKWNQLLNLSFLKEATNSPTRIIVEMGPKNHDPITTFEIY